MNTSMIWAAIISSYTVCWFLWICWELRRAYVPSDEQNSFHQEDEHWLVSHHFISPKARGKEDETNLMDKVSGPGDRPFKS